MQTVNPVMPVVNNDAGSFIQVDQVPAVNPLEQVPAPTANEVAGCVMPFKIEQITRLEIQFPWAFLAPEFEVAYISREGDLIVAEEAPRLNKTLGQFELIAGTRYVTIGKVPAESAVHWENSITFRPETEVEEKEEVTEKEPVKQPDVIVDTVDWSAASNNKKRKQAHLLKSQGVAKEDAHPALHPFWG